MGFRFVLMAIVDSVVTDGSDVGGRVGRPTLLGVVSRRVRYGDLLLLAVVPLVLLVAYSLPLSTRATLALAYDDPTVLAVYGSHYVHLTRWHLLGNLAGYLLVVPTAYVLSVGANRRRQFFVVFAAFVIAVPLALSALNLLFARPRIGVGFSGILLAFVGYLPVALLGVADQRLGLPVDRLRSQWLFFLGLAIIAYVSGPQLLGAAIAAAAILASVLFLLPIVDDWNATHYDRLRHALGRAGTVELLLVGALVFVGYLFVAFPGEVTRDGALVNVYSHVLGYSLGYVTTYLAVLSGGLNVD